MISRKDQFSYVLQISNGIIPLISIPLISRSTNLDFMGRYFIFLSVLAATQSIVDYGFNLSGIRSFIELKKKSYCRMKKLSLVLSITFSRLLIGAGLLVLFCISGQFGVTTNDKFSYAGIVLGIALSVSNPVWILFAIGESIVHAASVLVTRMLALLPLLWHDINLELAIAVTVIPMLISNGVSVLVISLKRKFKTDESRLEIEIVKQFKEGWSIFANSVLVSLVTLLWPITLSPFLSAAEIGVYGIADKIMRGMMTVVSPVQSFLMASSSKKRISEIIKTHIYKFACITVVIFAIPLAFITLPNEFLGKVFGEKIIEWRRVLNVYALGFVFGAVHLTIYAEMVRDKIERVYIYFYPISVMIAMLLMLIIDQPIYAPLATEIVATITAFYWLHKHASRTCAK